MATNIKDYSTPQASNTSLNTINVGEGMLPSNLNNAIRALMKNTRDWFNDAQWIEYGDGSGSYTATYVSGTAFTIDGVDVTAFYHAKRRIQIVDTASTLYGTISSTSFSTNTTVNVTWDSGSLTSGAITSVYLGVLTNTNDSIPTGIDAAKLADGTVSDTEFQYINSVSSNVQTQIDAKVTTSANLTDIAALANTNSNFIVGDGSNFVAETGSTARTSLGLGTVATQAANSIAITGGSVTGMSAPSSGSDVTTKTYVDDLVSGLKTRIICRVATTAAITLSSDLENGDTLDGITLATSDRVLVKDQSTDTENGIYLVVASGTASRDPEYDTVAELAGQLQLIKQGTSNADSMWLCTTDSGSIGSASITYSQVFPTSGGTVTSVAVSDAGSSEFTVSGSPITAAGTITLAVNSIAATKIADGSVTDAEFQYINSLSSNAQTQIDTKVIGKVEGTNFTNSLLVGHSTTGTLSSAEYNTGCGLATLDAITQGDHNACFGYNAGTTITWQGQNTCIGSLAGAAGATLGSTNTLIGSVAGYVITGDGNICLGVSAGANITTGDGNVVIGRANVTATGDDQLSISDGVNGAVVWMTGDNSGNVIHTGTTHSAGGQLTTTGKALVIGF